MAMNQRLLRPTASGFSPSSLANLEAWLDASQSSTVTLNGSTVSEWRDRRSASSVKVSQPVAGQQPTWVASSKNGLSGINFPAGRTVTSASFAFNQPTTFFTVFQAPTSAGTWAFFDGSVTRQHVYGNSQTEIRMFAGVNLGPVTIVGSAWYAAVLIYNGASSLLRLNTKTATTGNPGTNAMSGLVIGTATGLRGDLNEFGMLSRAVTDAEAGKLLDYMAKKWAITLT